MDPLPLQLMTQQFEKRFRKIRKVDPSAVVKGKWTIYSRTHEKTPISILGYLARNINCVDTSLNDYDENQTLITLRESKNGEVRSTQMDEVTFLERYLNHIPPKGSVVVRYYGLYSNRHRTELLNARAQVEKEPRPEVKPYQMECPNCKKEMRLVSIEWNIKNNMTERYRAPPGPKPDSVA